MNEAVDQLDRTVRAVIGAAMNADEHTVHAALGELASAGTLGEPTVCFLAQARAGALAMTICLANVLEIHAEAFVLGCSTCRECQTTWPCRTRRRLSETLALHQIRPAVPLSPAR